jgi:RNA polymerase sigma factor (sigma-70 family)
VVLDSDLVAQLAERLAQEDAYFQRRHDALSRCLDRLPERERQLITGYYSQAQTVKDLATLMGLPVQGLYKRLQRIRAALRNCIDAAVAWEGGT